MHASMHAHTDLHRALAAITAPWQPEALHKPSKTYAPLQDLRSPRLHRNVTQATLLQQWQSAINRRSKSMHRVSHVSN